MNTDTIIEAIQVHGLRILVAIIILVVGKWLAGVARDLARKAMLKSKVDDVLVGFLSNLLYGILLVAVVISAIGKAGIETTSFVAVLGAAGLAVGFALQGSLSNFAAGVMIILFRPFKTGDFVDIGGTTGTVVEIGILFSILKSPDNKRVIVPNSQVMGGTITNFSANGTRRVDMVFGVSYSDDIDQTKALLTEIIAEDDRVLPEPEPSIVLAELGDSSVNFNVRPWVNVADYWNVYFDTHEKVKKRFDAAGISIPFPQRDVHLFQEK